eukprot:20372-Prymnesium_polylepis.1
MSPLAEHRLLRKQTERRRRPWTVVPRATDPVDAHGAGRRAASAVGGARHAPRHTHIARHSGHGERVLFLCFTALLVRQSGASSPLRRALAT